jgi:hypothetical protein
MHKIQSSLKFTLLSNKNVQVHINLRSFTINSLEVAAYQIVILSFFGKTFYLFAYIKKVIKGVMYS